MFKKEAFKKGGEYRCEFKYSLDYDLFLRIAEYYRVYNMAETLCKYRIAIAGVSATRHYQQKKYAELARSLAKQRRQGKQESLDSINFDLSHMTLINQSIYYVGHLLSTSKYWYEIGCIYFYKGYLDKARKIFFNSLKYNIINIKSFVFWIASYIPFGLSKYLRILMKETSKKFTEAPNTLE